MSGGADQGLFSINASNVVVTFNNAPDFENPGDVGTDNNYNIQVTVTDSGGLTAVQDIVISVTDVGENPAYTFTKTVNDQDANTLAEAVVVNVGETITFAYILENTGDLPLLWNRLNDNVFDPIVDLTDGCGLPVVVPINGTYTCFLDASADNAPNGIENIGTPAVFIDGTNTQLQTLTAMHGIEQFIPNTAPVTIDDSYTTGWKIPR